MILKEILFMRIPPPNVFNYSNVIFFPSLRILQGNRIRSITKKAFTGLDALEHLWVTGIQLPKGI